MTTRKHSFFKIAICVILAIMLLPAAKIGTLFADSTETLTVSNLVSDYIDGKEKDQEITTSLGINTDFGDSYGYATTDGWTIPSYKDITITQVNAGDFTSDATIGFSDENDVKFNKIGTDKISGNKYGLLFMLKEEGVAGIESPSITIPANAYYVLTFNVKMAEITSSAKYGINAKIVEEDGTITSLDAIKSESSTYKTYAFLIQGNEHSEKTVKLQLFFGNVVETKDSTEEEKEYEAKKQVGYAAVDTVRMFSVTYSQYQKLAENKSTTEPVSLLSQNSSYVSIPNGYFNETNNQKWELSQNTALSDLRPTNWTQTGAADTTYGVINTNETLFNNKLLAAGITNAVNPGNADKSETLNNYNNVLMLYNKTAAYLTVKSDEFKLAKNSYYKISFKFNTPATANQTNKISFYVVDADGKTIYSKENMVSYTEFDGNNNEWATFNLFIETSSDEKKVNFVIKLGTETANAEGAAYVDEVNLSKVTADLAFNNDQENKFVLKGEEGAETTYLEKGKISFENLANLDQTNSSNNSLAYYSYKTVTAEADKETNTNKNEETTKGSSFNESMLWYVIPSVLLAVCLIAGLILYYVKKIKIKKPKKKPKKAAYDRKQTLNKQMAKREKEGNLVNKEELQKQLETVEKEIEELEKQHAVEKQNKYTRQKYQAKLQNLQTKQENIKKQLEK